MSGLPRRRVARSRIGGPLAAVCLLALTACSNGGGGGSSTPSGSVSGSASASGTGQAAVIVIKNFAFEPSTLTVAPGTKVTIRNEDSVTHTLTASGGGKPFDTGDIAAGASGTFAAPSGAGSYPYICTIHPFMKGTLTVS
ncbi:cupredoxin family copper-binding protein [Streptomyces sp. NPDC058001]|uniref:cupredoxin domain-containing protein n=1 Tax=Streptomyces sp. NPDC058001 TaxID=3346300 RepID=UPI0036E5C644